MLLMAFARYSMRCMQVPGEVEVFVRELVAPNLVGKRNMPYLLYLQGEVEGGVEAQP